VFWQLSISSFAQSLPAKLTQTLGKLPIDTRRPLVRLITAMPPSFAVFLAGFAFCPSASLFFLQASARLLVCSGAGA